MGHTEYRAGGTGGQGGGLPPHPMADQLALFQTGGLIMPTTLLLDPTTIAKISLYALSWPKLNFRCYLTFEIIF